MARRRAELQTHDEHDEVIRWYRDELAKPAVLPWTGLPWEPVRIGPTWQTDGEHWVLPDATLGWDMLGWWGTNLQLERDVPWRCTLEQARWTLWWYAVDGAGRFLFRDAVIQRLKGWGKDPLGACLLYGEMLGPCRFAGWDGDTPIATDNPVAWCQTAAVSLTQTKNTMRLMPGLITPEAEKHYGVHVGKELIHACGDQRLIQALTSSPKTLQGARATFVLPNETHEWDRSNGGVEMAAVIDDNATKSPDGAARTVRITNAYDPSEGSVAQADREAWEAIEAGTAEPTGLMYDSLEAPPDAPLADAEHVIPVVRGDSIWLKPDRIAQRVLDARNPPSRSRRFWFNQITATEEAWIVPQDFDLCADHDRVLDVNEPTVLFFDGSKSDDATALMACRLSDGHLFTMGMWQRPPGLDRTVRWLVPRHDVDARVSEVVEAYRIVALFADPSHTLDDVTEERYWDGVIDEWHRRWKGRFDVWATPGKGGHSVMWDMAGPGRTAEFTAAAERFVSDVEQSARAAEVGVDRVLTHDGDGRLVRHVRNAQRYPNRYGVSLWKGHRESPKKIDLAVCAVGARMLRRLVLNVEPKQTRTGHVW